MFCAIYFFVKTHTATLMPDSNMPVSKHEPGYLADANMLTPLCFGFVISMLFISAQLLHTFHFFGPF